MSKRVPSPIHRAAAGVTSAVGGALRATQTAGQALAAGRLAAAVHTGDLEALRGLLEGGTAPDMTLPDRPFTPLMVACGRDFVEGARLLLAHGADRNALAPGYGTPLTFALSSPQRAAVPLLLEAGVDPNLAPKGISAPLIFALTEKDAPSVRLLLAHGADPNAQDSAGWSALAVALAEHMDALIADLLQAGARPDHVEPDGRTPLATALDGLLEPLALAMLDVPDLDPATFLLPDGRSLLDLAAAGGLRKAGERLLDRGLAVDGPADAKVPPLHRALIYGQPDFADLLLARGATVANGEQAPTLRAAAFVGHLGCLEAGQRQGLDVCTPELLEAAALGGSVKALTWLKDQGIDLACVPEGDTLPALHAAALRGRTEALRWLLGQGVPVDLHDQEGITALGRALDEDASPSDAGLSDGPARDPLPAADRLAALDVLLEAGADLASEARKDAELLDLLLECGRDEVVLGLLERGLPLPHPEEAVFAACFRESSALLRTFLAQGHPATATDPANGETGLHVAAVLDRPEHVDLLVAAGAPVDAIAAGGRTPLLAACLEGSREAAGRLLAHGANTNTQDAEGWSPLMLAAHGGHAALVQLLLKHGAKRSLKNRGGATALTYARKLKRKDLMKLLD